LRAAGHRVSVFGFLRKGDAPAEDPDRQALAEITIENAAASPTMLAGWLLAALKSGLPLAAAKLLKPARLLPEALRAHGPFDAIILNSVMVPGACPEIMDLAPCLLVEHNVEHLSAGENAAHARNPLMRWLFSREARTLKTLEHAVAARARFVWFLAEEDRQRLGLDVSERSAILPLVPTTTLAPPARAAEQGYDVGLIGTWTWGPNRIGLEWFLNEVAPPLPGHVSVGVAGRIPEGLAPPRRSVTFLGRVPDAGAFLASCRTLALASRAGTGVQLKTLEAFQLGKPAVATPLSLRGFAEHPANMRIADSAPEFAASLVALVADARAGRVGDLDGAAFLERQKAVMQAAIARGLVALGA